MSTNRRTADPRQLLCDTWKGGEHLADAAAPLQIIPVDPRLAIGPIWPVQPITSEVTSEDARAEKKTLQKINSGAEDTKTAKKTRQNEICIESLAAAGPHSSSAVLAAPHQLHPITVIIIRGTDRPLHSCMPSRDRARLSTSTEMQMACNAF